MIYVYNNTPSQKWVIYLKSNSKFFRLENTAQTCGIDIFRGGLLLNNFDGDALDMIFNSTHIHKVLNKYTKAVLNTIDFSTYVMEDSLYVPEDYYSKKDAEHIKQTKYRSLSDVLLFALDIDGYELVGTYLYSVFIRNVASVEKTLYLVATVMSSSINRPEMILTYRSKEKVNGEYTYRQYNLRSYKSARINSLKVTYVMSKYDFVLSDTEYLENFKRKLAIKRIVPEGESLNLLIYRQNVLSSLVISNISLDSDSVTTSVLIANKGSFPKYRFLIVDLSVPISNELSIITQHSRIYRVCTVYIDKLTKDILPMDLTFKYVSLFDYVNYLSKDGIIIKSESFISNYNKIKTNSEHIPRII